MMKLTKRIIASRNNGARSRGPTTPEGKARSSRNAITHGCLAKHVLLWYESEEVFNTVMVAMMDKFEPADRAEFCAVEDYTDAVWRKRRLMVIEKGLFDLALSRRTETDGPQRFACAFQDLADGPAL